MRALSVSLLPFASMIPFCDLFFALIFDAVWMIRSLPDVSFPLLITFFFTEMSIIDTHYPRHNLLHFHLLRTFNLNLTSSGNGAVQEPKPVRAANIVTAAGNAARTAWTNEQAVRESSCHSCRCMYEDFGTEK